MGSALSLLGRKLATALTRSRHVHSAEPVCSAAQLQSVLQAGDVLLVEGNSRISTVIKFLTQSNWSHAALFVGTDAATGQPGFIEADMLDGVRLVGLEEFSGWHTRICRPFGLNPAERRQICDYARQRLGNQYDLRNVLDLARYFFPALPVPQRFRRRLLALGSGDPTRAICSTLIAQAFQSVRYPILPDVSLRSTNRPECPGCVEEIYRIRHHSLFTPKDFDVSPYFSIVNPLQAAAFDFHRITWEA